MRFLVADNLSEPCILGRPGIDLFGAWKYSPKAKRFLLHGIHIPLCDMYGTEEGLVTKIAETVTIPPRTVQHVSLDVPDKRKCLTRLLYVEPNNSFVARTGLVPLPTVAKQNGLISTKVSNFSDEPVTVTTGDCFGTAEAVSFSNAKCKRKSTRHPSPSLNSIMAEDCHKFLDENLDLSGSALTEQEREELKALLYEYADIFSVADYDLGHCHLAEHVIDTGNAKPNHQRPYRAEFQKGAIIEKEVNKMLEIGIAEPSNSNWSSPVVLFTKKGGSIRFCVNYIKLNKVTVRDSYILPRIDDILQTLANSSHFSSLDLASGYWQIPVSDKYNSKDKTTFTCFLGTYRFRYLPFGLINAL